MNLPARVWLLSCAVCVLIASTHADVSAATFSHDGLNRLNRVVYGPNLTIDYVYDAAGNLIEERINNAVAVTVAAQSNPSAGGAVSVSPTKPRYLTGENVTLTASPAAGYSFSSWSGVAGCSTNPVCAVTVGAVNISATANFTANPASCSLVSGPSVAPASSATQSYSATCINTTAYAWTLNGTGLPACTTSNCDITFPTNGSTSTVPFTVQVAPASTPSASASLAVTQAGASVCTSIAGNTTVPNLGGSFSWTATCLNTSAYVWTINDQSSSCTGATCQVSFVGNGSQNAAVYTIKVAPANAPTAIASIVVSQTGVSACNSVTGPTTIGPAAGSQTYSASCANTASYVWTLDGATLAGCTTASCAVSFGANTGTTTVNHTVQVAPANNVSASASVTVAQTGVATCTAISGPSAVAASAGSQSYSATCANTSTYVWTLDGVTIATCTGTTCNVPFAANTSTTSVARSLKVAPSNNVASFATFAIMQAGASVCSSLGGPVSVVASANSQSYTATCANTSTFSWTLDGAAIPACTGATCSVAFTANSATTTVNHAVQVAPANNLTAAASLTVAQAGASACSAVSGPTSLSANGGSQSYSATCANTTAYVWSLNGTAVSGCTTATCSISFPVNAATTTLAFTVQVAPSNAPTAIASLAVTQAGASVCTAISGPTTVVAAGGNVTWTATCANTSAYVWTLDNQPTSCTTATCQLAIPANTSQTAANHTVKVSPANAATSVASLVFSQTGVSACNSVSGPTTVGSAASSQTYTASCANTSSYVWTLDGVALPACTTISCAVSFAANAVTTAANHTVQVAPANNTDATASVAVVQAGASVCTAVTGPISAGYSGPVFSYTATCANTTTYAWTLNGSSLAGCNTSSCNIKFPANTTYSVITYTVRVAPTSAPSASASLTVSQIVPPPQCTAVSGPSSVAATGGAQTYSSTCDGATNIAWSYAGSAVSGCTTGTCVITIPQNTSGNPVTGVVQVTGSNTSGSGTQTLSVTTAAATPKVISVTVSPVAGGDVALNPANANYSYGEVVQLTPTALSGYRFAGWSGYSNCGTLPANPDVCVVTMPLVDVAITANFAACTYTLTPTTITVPYGGASNSVTVTTQMGCAWSLDSTSTNWLNVAPPVAGVGSAARSVTASANSGAVRTGSVQVNGNASVAVTVNQDGYPSCTAVSGSATVPAVGGAQSYSATCANTSSYRWSLDGMVVAGCTGATCAVNFGANASTSAASHVVNVAPASNVTASASLTVSQVGAAACTVISGPNVVPAAASTQTYSATCANTTTYVWTLGGVLIPSCTGASCGVSFPERTFVSQAILTLAVAPSTNPASPFSFAVTQSGATRCIRITGQTAIGYAGGSFLYTSVCANLTTFAWSLNGVPVSGCNNYTCNITLPANTTYSPIAYTVSVAPGDVPSASASLSVTQSIAPPQCSALTGPSSVGATGGAQTYSATCDGATSFAWSYAGTIIGGCSATACAITIPQNTTSSPVTGLVQITAANTSGSATQSLSVTTAAATPKLITVATAPAAGGSVALNPANLNYNYGDVVQLTPTAQSGYRFAGWSGYSNCGTLHTNPDVCVVTMPLVDVAITANFAACTYTLTPASITVPYSGASNTVAVTTQPGCVWSLGSTASNWLTVGVPMSGSGTATRSVTATANLGTMRSGSVQVNDLASGAVSVIQDAAPTCSAVTGSTTAPPTGGTQSYSATCANTTAYQWQLDGAVITSCTGVSCAVTFAASTGSVPVSHLVSVAPAANNAAAASLTVTQSPQPPACSSVTGPTTVVAEGAMQSYAALCVGTASYLWSLDGVTIAGCAAETCAVAFQENKGTTVTTHTVRVAPATAPSAAASMAVTQNFHSPVCTTLSTSAVSFAYTGATVTVSLSCTATLTYAWTLDGLPLACITDVCAVTLPPNYALAALPHQVGVTANGPGGFANPLPLNLTVAAAPACTLDFDGDGIVGPTDALLFNRWLLGFRGDSLVAGVTLAPPGITASTFALAVANRFELTAAHDFDGDGRVLSHTDGLIFTRLVEGLTGNSVPTNATGSGAVRPSYGAIRSHVNGVCGTNFAPAEVSGPSPSVSIDTTQVALTAMNATFPATTTYSFITGVNGRSAVKFNGITSPGAIHVPNSAGMQFTSGATIDLWARIDGNTGLNGNGQSVSGGWAMALVAKSHDSGSVSLNAFATDPNYAGSGYGFAVWASSVPGWGTSTCTIVNRNPGDAVGTWFRLTAVASISTGTRIYHNKQLVYSCPGAVPNFAGMNAQDLYIGKYRDTWYPLNGAVQDIRIYQNALTDAEIQALP